ncbi:MAG: hypothetical protein OEM01_05375 [Desulfobulbaceae bacterium]|nr:hypothetical protein [Desulfobulbaceae bacterium]
MQIYTATDGPNWLKQSGGNTPWDENGPVCNGDSGTVRCLVYETGTTRTTHVVELNLRNVGMVGALPGSAFTDLPYLRQIDLSANSLYGLIPIQIAELPSLRTLILTNNDFTGAIPEALLGSGPSLPPSLSDRLDLSSNNFSGYLPLSPGRDDVKSLRVMSNPNLQGPIPATYTQLAQMASFYYRGTQICEPQDQAMQDWLAGVSVVSGTGISCFEPPPGFTPDTPSSITASDGTSIQSIFIQWDASVGADSYMLQRQINNADWVDLATQTTTTYEDFLPGGFTADYRVSACYSSGNCSLYTNDERGYKGVDVPKSIHRKDIPVEEGGIAYLFYWDPATSATYYNVYIANDEKYYAKYDKENFHFGRDIINGTDEFLAYGRPDVTSKTAVAVQGCHNLACGEVVVWNPMRPISHILSTILLKD